KPVRVINGVRTVKVQDRSFFRRRPGAEHA
ncbi:MAG: hypothetical protein ACI9MF_001111, partial [Gammaproteobacteria bacterium]